MESIIVLEVYNKRHRPLKWLRSSKTSAVKKLRDQNPTGTCPTRQRFSCLGSVSILKKKLTGTARYRL
jgi:hypothetical protein